MIQFLVFWYVLGVIGCVAGTASDWYGGEDVTLGTILKCTLASLMGPLTILLALMYIPINIKPITIFKGRRNNVYHL